MYSPMGLTIREADPENDWLTGIWPIFRSVIQAGDTYAFAPETDEPAARLAWMLPPPARVFVAVDEERNTILGTSLLKANQPGLGAHVANAGFMVAAHAQGNGVGTFLAENALAWARAAGFAAMQFNYVVSTNSRAMALWKRLGFSVVGRVPQAFAHRVLGQRVDVVIMHRFL